jgi:hypothetical protein
MISVSLLRRTATALVRSGQSLVGSDQFARERCGNHRGCRPHRYAGDRSIVPCADAKFAPPPRRRGGSTPQPSPVPPPAHDCQASAPPRSCPLRSRPQVTQLLLPSQSQDPSHLSHLQSLRRHSAGVLRSPPRLQSRLLPSRPPGDAPRVHDVLISVFTMARFPQPGRIALPRRASRASRDPIHCVASAVVPVVASSASPPDTAASLQKKGRGRGVTPGTQPHTMRRCTWLLVPPSPFVREGPHSDLVLRSATHSRSAFHCRSLRR